MKKYFSYIYIFIFFLIILKVLVGKTYFPIYPGIPIYPNNFEESKKVINYINTRTSKDIDFFYKTNKSVCPVFLIDIEENIYDLENIIFKTLPLILFLKLIFNRARPSQINNLIKPINIDTAQTPAFPAGHAFDAYYLSKYLSKKYPGKKEIFEKIAYDCDLVRVKAGLHYPSDGAFSKKLVDIFL